MQLMALNALLLFDAIFIFFLFLVSVSCLLYYLPLVPPTRSSSLAEELDIEESALDTSTPHRHSTPCAGQPHPHTHYCHLTDRDLDVDLDIDHYNRTLDEFTRIQMEDDQEDEEQQQVNKSQQLNKQQDNPTTHIIMTPPQRKYYQQSSKRDTPFAPVETV